MSPVLLNKQLEGVGRKVSWWRALFKIKLGAAALVVGIFIFGLVDLQVQYGRIGRMSSWAVLVALLLVAGWWVRRTLQRRFTHVAVAAMMERAFPQLDNRLINYLQFAASPGDDPFKQAYIKHGAPDTNRLDQRTMKNRKLHKRAFYGLLVSIVMLVTPGAFLGKAWGIAVWRVINPFSDTMPATLTRIVSVDPGNTNVIQGASLVLSCRVEGRSGHKVTLEVDPADGELKTYALGRISGADAQSFSHAIPKVNTALTYRFRAGDAAFPKLYAVDIRPPLGLEQVNVTVIPPEYTGLPEREYNASDQKIPIAGGSTLRVEARANRELTRATLERGNHSQTMAPGNEGIVWTGELVVDHGEPVKVAAISPDGGTAEQWINFDFNADQVPAIKIISPEGRPVLPDGVQPTIVFDVADDYGIVDVTIERVRGNGTSLSGGEPLAMWAPDGERAFMQTWSDPSWRSRDDKVLAYRVMARDNGPSDDPNRVARSEVIVFVSPSAAELAQKRNALEERDLDSLQRVIELQRSNLARTMEYRDNLENTATTDWQAISEVQGQIRTIMRNLLSSPINPLGNLTDTAKKLYLNEMAEIIPLLVSVPQSSGATRANRADSAVRMEQKILRQLTVAESSAAKAKVQRRASALTGMLQRMIREQGVIIRETDQFILQGTEVAETLVDRQDELSLDITDFIAECKRESAAVIGNDENFSQLLIDVAKAAEDKQIRDDCLLAAEALDENRPAQARPHEEQSHTSLKALKKMLDEVLAEEALEENEALLEEIAEAKERIEKIRKVQAQAIENMDMVKDQLDKGDKDFDVLEEEFQEVMKNTEEAMLQVPTDLNIFMELNVANDLVEDCFSVFEEVQQAAGSENLGAGDVSERAVAKREEYLEKMEEARDAMDALEMWLMDRPDSLKVTTEAFDQEEMPEAGMALGALTTEVEDLIGDLLEKNEEMSQEADDGAVNTAVPDMQPSEEVKEGDVASFGAKGKSGNEAPDHKEQDGRSIVGREGMATGETAAGSGTVGEGDKNIEERRTQDPTTSGQVDLDGETQTKATGGGKLASGKADKFGMTGGVKRMDSNEAGSQEGKDALMAEQLDQMYAKASMQNVRAGDLKDAAHHLRQAADAVAKGNIAQLKEHRRLAAAKMRKAQAEIDAALTGSFTVRENPSLLDQVIEGGPEVAPPEYRDMVSDYYRELNKQM